MSWRTIALYGGLMATSPAGVVTELTIKGTGWGSEWRQHAVTAGLAMVLGGPLLALLAWTSRGHRLWLRCTTGLALQWTAGEVQDKYEETLSMTDREPTIHTIAARWPESEGPMTPEKLADWQAQYMAKPARDKQHCPDCDRPMDVRMVAARERGDRPGSRHGPVQTPGRLLKT